MRGGGGGLRVFALLVLWVLWLVWWPWENLCLDWIFCNMSSILLAKNAGASRKI